MKIEGSVAGIVERGIGRALHEDSSREFDRGGRPQRLGAKTIHIKRHCRAVRGVGRERDQLTIEMGESVENLIAGDGIGRGGAARCDGA
jgi:hypothetical protein